MEIVDEMETCFGSMNLEVIPSSLIGQLLKSCWTGALHSDELRALHWRVLLGIFSSTDKGMWKGQFERISAGYSALKSKVMPSLDKVTVDPLTALLEEDDSMADIDNAAHPRKGEEWDIYYKNMDLMNLIRNDLDRLYITGIEDEYFQVKKRRDMLLPILLVWSYLHPVISYRQGMHEVAGYVLYCVELEAQAWGKVAGNLDVADRNSLPAGLMSLKDIFLVENVEASTYSLFSRIMNELEPLYDPIALTPRGAEHQPFVVQYCGKIQEHYLNMLDPDLSNHLEECHVAAQLYGMRWSRLLLGREFSVEDGDTYKLWDYLFACCYEAENSPSNPLTDIDTPPNIISMVASVRIAGYNQHSNHQRRTISSFGTVKHVSANEIAAPVVPAYVCTPLLGALGDLMLAMLLQIRSKLMQADSSMVLAYLMHYPEEEPVQSVLEFANMIKRGVILEWTNRKYYKPHSEDRLNDKLLSQSPQRTIPTTKDGGQSLAGSQQQNNWMEGMKQRVTDKFQAVTTAVGSGLNDIVNNLAELSEEFEHDFDVDADIDADEEEEEEEEEEDGEEELVGDFMDRCGKKVRASERVSSDLDRVRLVFKDSAAPIANPQAASRTALPHHHQHQHQQNLPGSNTVAAVAQQQQAEELEEEKEEKEEKEEETPEPLLTGMGSTYKNLPQQAVDPLTLRPISPRKTNPSSSSSSSGAPRNPAGRTRGGGGSGGGGGGGGAGADAEHVHDSTSTVASSPSSSSSSSLTGLHIRSRLFNAVKYSASKDTNKDASFLDSSDNYDSRYHHQRQPQQRLASRDRTSGDFNLSIIQHNKTNNRKIGGESEAAAATVDTNDNHDLVVNSLFAKDEDAASTIKTENVQIVKLKAELEEARSTSRLVADRLILLVNELNEDTISRALQFSTTATASTTITANPAVRKKLSQKIRLLADVLVGDSTVQAYEELFPSCASSNGSAGSDRSASLQVEEGASSSTAAAPTSTNSNNSTSTTISTNVGETAAVRTVATTAAIPSASADNSSSSTSELVKGNERLANLLDGKEDSSSSAQALQNDRTGSSSISGGGGGGGRQKRSSIWDDDAV